MKKKRKKFEWPKKIYDKPRIINENKLKLKYGLKNKKEIWKTEAKIKYYRTRAKNLITAEQKEQEMFLSKLNKIGLKVKNIAEVLALDKEDLLKRRLPSVIAMKKMANTPKQARQMVVHKRVSIGNNAINVPSYLVKIDEEDLIRVKKKIKKKRIKESNENNSEIEETKHVEVMEAKVNA